MVFIPTYRRVVTFTSGNRIGMKEQKMNKKRRGCGRMKKRLACIVVMVLLASAASFAIMPASAYEEKIPGDADENDELTKAELSSAILPYMLGEGDLKLDDVGDAAYVYAYWDGKPKTLTDQCDREVTFYRPVERVVSSFPSLTRAIVEVDGVDRLVGVSSYIATRGASMLAVHVYPELTELPGVNSYRDPNLEQMLSLKPDVVFSSSSSPPQTCLIQTNTGIPTIGFSTSYPYEGEGGAFDGYRLIGKVLGKEERVEELISCVDEEFDKVRGVTSEIPDSERVSVYFCSGSTITKGRANIDFEPIEIAGGIDVTKGSEYGSGRAVSITKEQLIKWNPDIILVHSSSKSHGVSIEDVLTDSDLQSINAVKNGTVYYAQTGYIGLVIAISTTQVPYMAKLFYPEKFEDLDVEESGNRILEKYYGVDGLYTYLQESRDLYRWD